MTYKSRGKKRSRKVHKLWLVQEFSQSNTVMYIPPRSRNGTLSASQKLGLCLSKIHQFPEEKQVWFRLSFLISINVLTVYRSVYGFLPWSLWESSMSLHNSSFFLFSLLYRIWLHKYGWCYIYFRISWLNFGYGTQKSLNMEKYMGAGENPTC